MKGAFATRIAGSADLYNNHNRKPYHGINFIIAHDGFSLYDLVSYNSKHNEANGENNMDGSNDNFSWNCGAEGETTNEGILNMRFKQMRNFTLALMVSQGTPMMVMGECLSWYDAIYATQGPKGGSSACRVLVLVRCNVYNEVPKTSLCTP